MNKNIDYHIHTNFSSDSNIDAEELVKKAIKQNFKEIAITDHFDLNPVDVKKFGILDLEEYINTLEYLKKKYKDKIKINIGLEIGEYHRFKSKIFKKLKNINNLDVIIGSVHRTQDDTNMSVPIDEPFKEETIHDYFNENLKIVKNPEIDILGHLGIFQRYYYKYHDNNKYNSIINNIFNYMQLNNIALEINFSGLRKNIDNLIPSIPLIKDYLNRGGNLLTIGSDIHCLDEMKNSYYKRAIKILKNNGINFLSIKENNKWKNIKI